MKYVNLACVLHLYYQHRIKISEKTYKRLKRRLEALYPMYIEYDTKEIIKDTDIVMFDEIRCVDGVIVDRKPIQMTENIIWEGNHITDNELRHNKFS